MSTRPRSNLHDPRHRDGDEEPSEEGADDRADRHRHHQGAQVSLRGHHASSLPPQPDHDRRDTDQEAEGPRRLHVDPKQEEQRRDDELAAGHPEQAADYADAGPADDGEEGPGDAVSGRPGLTHGVKASTSSSAPIPSSSHRMVRCSVESLTRASHDDPE